MNDVFLRCVLGDDLSGLAAPIHDGNPIGNAHHTGVNGRRDIQTTMAATCSAKEGVAVKVDEITGARFNQ
ncbi:hypothetical protein [Labrys neptuniae]